MSHRIRYAERHAGNTLAIVDGCHRVVKKDGSLCGARACVRPARGQRPWEFSLAFPGGSRPTERIAGERPAGYAACASGRRAGNGGKVSAIATAPNPMPNEPI